MTPSMTDRAVKAAIAAIESEAATLKEKIEMLIEMATGFLKKPKGTKDMYNAVALYERAIALCGEDYPRLRGRALAGMGTALRTIPSQGKDLLLQAKAAYKTALPLLQEFASPQEVAEAQMNLGIVLQALVPFNLARIKESIQMYQRALQVFTAEAYPQEYAILRNNIAIVYLSSPSSSDRQDLRQALAVKEFEEALKRITLIDQPNEYAMLQNNLGNALQYLPSAHPVENNVRALAAYDESLKVRNPKDTPLEYANTISNKANALSNLPDNLDKPKQGNHNNLLKARAYYQEAKKIFIQHKQIEQAHIVAQALEAIDADLQSYH